VEAQCTAMKTAGIRIITVSFDLAGGDNDPTKTRLKNCASENLDKKVAAGQPNERYYFDVDPNDELASAFGIIRDSLAHNMFISQ
jgi:hypothetical protein